MGSITVTELLKSGDMYKKSPWRTASSLTGTRLHSAHDSSDHRILSRERT